MSDRFSASPEELRGLAAELAALRDELDRIGSGPGSDAAAVGHFELFERLASAAANWSDRRDELVDRIQRLAGFARAAADAYAECETEVAGTFAPPVGPTATAAALGRR
jgi:hypothetical protein